MPRRTAVYDGNMGWNQANYIATVGAFILGLGIFVYFAVMIYTYFKGEKSGRDPWDGRTLEWSIAHPPAEYNFPVIPTVHARDAFWYEKHHADEISKEKAAHAKAEESHGGIHMPSQSWFPFVTATGMLIGGLFFAGRGAFDQVMSRMLGQEIHGWGTIGAICGLVIVFVGALLWSLEGPGGYHLHLDEHGNEKPHDASHH
jgi:cytochrome c oxidase subunit I